MPTFTQIGDTLSVDNPYIGNQFSDVIVSVLLTDDTFTDFNHLDLCVCDPVARKTWRSSVVNGQAAIDHTALAHFGDVYVALAGYGNSQGQLTTNSVPMELRRSANPEEAYDPDADWKLQVSDKLIREATEAAVNAYVSEHGLQIDVDDKPTEGSTNPVSSGGVFAAIKDLTKFTGRTGANYVRTGGTLICYGNTKLYCVDISTESGSVLQGESSFGTAAKKIATDLELTGAFPACFTSRPHVALQMSGPSATVWPSRVIADTAGITNALITRGKEMSKPSDISVRYIAVGRCDGARAVGAEVVSDALQWVGRQYGPDGSTAIGSYIIEQYNAFAEGNEQNSDAEWCSEFASVCAHNTGISTDIFPYFASAYRGSERFSNIGCWYKRSGTKFIKSTVTSIGTAENDHEDFTYTLDSSGETYVPQVGDVLWIGSGNHPTHTALVCYVSTETDDSGNYTKYEIYTVEGNLGIYSSSSVSDDTPELYRTVQRRVRDLCQDYALGNNVFAVGRVNYPEGSGGTISGGGSSADSSSGVENALTHDNVTVLTKNEDNTRYGTQVALRPDGVLGVDVLSALSTHQTVYGYQNYMWDQSNGDRVSNELYKCTSMYDISGETLLFTPESMKNGWVNFYESGGTASIISSVDITNGNEFIQIPKNATKMTATKPMSDERYVEWSLLRVPDATDAHRTFFGTCDTAVDAELLTDTDESTYALLEIATTQSFTAQQGDVMWVTFKNGYQHKNIRAKFAVNGGSEVRAYHGYAMGSSSDPMSARMQYLSYIANGAKVPFVYTGTYWFVQGEYAANANSRGSVLLSDAIDGTSGEYGGVAATPKAVQSALTAAKEYVDQSTLPAVTESDAGKILMVNSSGTWTATEIVNAEEVSY